MVSANVITAHEQSFQQSVLERSRDVPILVDFWAPWCGPCRVLSPILEGLAAQGGGSWLLAKVNTDENPALARRYGVRGIPYCVLFMDGEPVDSFVGSQNKGMVQEFLEKWFKPKSSDPTDAIEAQISRGELEEARTALDTLLAGEPDNEKVHLTYARLALTEGKPQDALEHLDFVPAKGKHSREAGVLAARARFESCLPASRPPLDELDERVEAAPDDFEARLVLGSAAALFDERELAAEQFFWILERERDWKDGAARRALLDLFTLWGDDAPETATYRQQLGRLLFS